MHVMTQRVGSDSKLYSSRRYDQCNQLEEKITESLSLSSPTSLLINCYCSNDTDTHINLSQQPLCCHTLPQSEAATAASAAVAAAVVVVAQIVYCQHQTRSEERDALFDVRSTIKQQQIRSTQQPIRRVTIIGNPSFNASYSVEDCSKWQHMFRVEVRR